MRTSNNGVFSAEWCKLVLINRLLAQKNNLKRWKVWFKRTPSEIRRYKMYSWSTHGARIAEHSCIAANAELGLKLMHPKGMMVMVIVVTS